MASNFTEHFQLNQWEASDQVKREDFNADNAKIDAAIRTVDSKAEVKSEVLFGSYTGDGKPERTIELGRKPKAVLIFSQSGQVYDDEFVFGGLAIQGVPNQLDGHTGISLTQSGFTVHYFNTASARALFTNGGGIVYLYLAFV